MKKKKRTLIVRIKKQPIDPDSTVMVDRETFVYVKQFATLDEALRDGGLDRVLNTINHTIANIQVMAFRSLVRNGAKLSDARRTVLHVKFWPLTDEEYEEKKKKHAGKMRQLYDAINRVQTNPGLEQPIDPNSTVRRAYGRINDPHTIDSYYVVKTPAEYCTCTQCGNRHRIKEATYHIPTREEH